MISDSVMYVCTEEVEGRYVWETKEIFGWIGLMGMDYLFGKDYIWGIRGKLRRGGEGGGRSG